MPSSDPRPPLRPPAPVPAPRRAPPGRRGAVAAVVGAALAAAACGGDDPFAIRATLETTLDTVVVYPLSRQQSLLPSALNSSRGSAVRPALLGGVVPTSTSPSTPTRRGAMVLLPGAAGGVATRRLAAHRVPDVTTTFDALDVAPRSGYRFDSLQVAAVGQTVVIEGQGVSGTGLYCGTSTPLHAKLVSTAWRARPVRCTPACARTRTAGSAG
jgi:hypothetical protein